MAANAIDNTNIKDMCNGGGTDGFTPALSYEYDAALKTVDFTHSSTFPDGDSVKSVHVRVHDMYGGEVRESMFADGSVEGDGSLDVSTLDASKGLQITATITSENGLVADGGAYLVQAAGDVSHWDKQRNATA